MDDLLAGSLPSGMAPRRSRYALTDESRIPHWLVTYDLFRRVLASKYLAIGADLGAEMRQANAECAVDGWTVENDGAYGFFFAIVMASEERFACNRPIHLNRYRSTIHRRAAVDSHRFGAPLVRLFREHWSPWRGRQFCTSRLLGISRNEAIQGDP